MFETHTHTHTTKNHQTCWIVKCVICERQWTSKSHAASNKRHEDHIPSYVRPNEIMNQTAQQVARPRIVAYPPALVLTQQKVCSLQTHHQRDMRGEKAMSSNVNDIGHN